MLTLQLLRPPDASLANSHVQPFASASSPDDPRLYCSEHEKEKKKVRLAVLLSGVSLTPVPLAQGLPISRANCELIIYLDISFKIDAWSIFYMHCSLV